MTTVQLDNPVSKKEEDHFQRYEFARRIAGIINSGTYPKSLVIAIYGKWGEGKSSVLNFIGKEIDPKAIRINFNPWYFQDDKLLIKSFFETIAAELGEKLKTRKEKIIDAFANYGDSLGGLANTVLPGSGIVAKAGTKLVSAFKTDGLEHYKKRIESLIREAKTNFVVFIDDIDRLNIDEIQSVFKLVKLLGDFPRFSYVMAFDDELVAASLGHKFGEKEIKDGYDFLEKIIQLPLTLPKATPAALRKYCLKQIQKSLTDLEIELEETELRDFRGKFETAFVPGLKNPRLAVRFANAIVFAIPLLQGETSLSDLMIIEGIKVFYPELYYFIRNRSDLFLTFYDKPNSAVPVDKDRARKLIDDQLNQYGKELGDKIREMLWVLFPQLNGLYNNFFYNTSIIDSWYQNRRICSSYYFGRYFSYAVIEGDISDVYFNDLFADVDKSEPADFARGLEKELRKLDLEYFIFKLIHITVKFALPEIQNLFVVLSMLGPQFPLQQKFSLTIPKIEMAKIIRTLISRLDPKMRLKNCLISIDVSQPMNYTLTLFQTFTDKSRRLPEEAFLTREESDSLGERVIKKYENERSRNKVFELYPEEDLSAIFEIYNTLGKNAEVNAYLKKRLSDPRDPGFAMKVVRIFTPTIYSTIREHPFKTLFTQENYEEMKKFIDTGLIYNNLITTYGHTLYTPEKQFSPGDECNDQDLMSLFYKIHDEVRGEIRFNP